MSDETLNCAEKETLTMLYEKLGRPALSKTMYLVKQQSVAEEIIQDIFISLWEKKLSFPNIRAAYAYVYRVCTHRAIDHLRGKSNQTVPILDENLVEDENANLDIKLGAKQGWDILVDKFSDQEAELFVYRYIEGLTQVEAAEVMGISRRSIARLQDKVDQKLARFRGNCHAG